jgi:tetratricopeptide (TPR) repeat protein/flagellar motor protein MotB
MLISQINPGEIDELIKTGSEQLIVNENSRLMQEDFLYYADKLAARLLEFDQVSCNYNYRKGFTTLYSKGDAYSAKKHFEIALANTSIIYDAYSKNEKSAPHDAIFHYAVCLHKLGDYDKAIVQFNLFKEKTRKDSELLPQVDLMIQQCNNAKMAIGPEYQAVNLNDVNTEYPDFSPIISLDGKQLFYTARRPWDNNQTENLKDRKYNFPPEDGYISIFGNSGWGTSERLKISKPKLNESGLAMSPNERELIMYSDTTGNGDLYFGKTTSDLLNPQVEPLNEILNSEFWETHATFSSDGNTIYFTSDRDGGLGGRDLYRSARGEDGKWSIPENLGAPVNSSADEDGPFLSFDGKILYFSSNGDKSYGGFDIFYSRLEDVNKWSVPQNMGAPYNTAYDDVFYTTTLNGKTAYFSSNRSGGKGNLDIYTVNGVKSLTQIAVFKGIIKTSTGEPLPEDVALDFNLKCGDCQIKEQQFILTPRLRDGTFYANLEPCRTYQITLYNPSKTPAFHEETFMTACDLSFQEIVREFIYDMDEKLIKVIPDSVEEVVSPIPAFANVEYLKYFEYNKNKVINSDEELKTVLAKIEDQIKAGRQSITINIYSSASKVPTKTYGNNEKLAQLRANNFQKQLIDIVHSKLEWKSKVTVKINTVIVDGPEYEKDSFNKGKYRPYQFVGFKTE